MTRPLASRPGCMTLLLGRHGQRAQHHGAGHNPRQYRHSFSIESVLLFGALGSLVQVLVP